MAAAASADHEVERRLVKIGAAGAGVGVVTWAYHLLRSQGTWLPSWLPGAFTYWSVALLDDLGITIPLTAMVATFILALPLSRPSTTGRGVTTALVSSVVALTAYVSWRVVEGTRLIGPVTRLDTALSSTPMVLGMVTLVLAWLWSRRAPTFARSLVFISMFVFWFFCFAGPGVIGYGI